MMEKAAFKVIAASNIQRCEICHQSDQLDEVGDCNRCKEVFKINKLRLTKPRASIFFSNNLPWITIRTPFKPVATGMIIGGVVGRIVGQIYYSLIENQYISGDIIANIFVSFHAAVTGMLIGMFFGILFGIVHSNIILFKARQARNNTTR
ncbi:MAG: hypothetical protein JNN15_14750 [Blastocatellia bacterium]|nr:hypothetical protein [Blastocatellia bacterium]